MEAASLPRRRRRRSSLAALFAVVVYAGALYVGWSIVNAALSPSTDAAAPAAPTGTGAVSGAGSTDLTLVTLAGRASRSVATVGESAGFVAWTTETGLSLVLTSRPVGGWKTGPARSVTVRVGSTEHQGTLVRADPRTGLGLVRVQDDLGRPLWQEPAATTVRPGDRLAVAGPGKPRLFSVTESRPTAIWGAGAGTRPGAPVLDPQGRVVGVTTGGRVVPIARACGVIRRC